MTCGLSPKCSSKVYWRLPGADTPWSGDCRFACRAAAATVAAGGRLVLGKSPLPIRFRPRGFPPELVDVHPRAAGPRMSVTNRFGASLKSSSRALRMRASSKSRDPSASSRPATDGIAR